jgi:sugar O-acyltransferase (sialic acid O-acetyltransferase NeuD family)
MKSLAIVGAGHLGQQIAHYAIADGHYSKVFFFDDFTKKTEVNGIEILGGLDKVLEFSKSKMFDEILVGIGYKHIEKRKMIYDFLCENEIVFGEIIHSSSWVDPSAIIQKGVVIYPDCSIDAQVVIKNNCVLNIGSVVAHDSVIGSHCFLSPRVAIAGFVDIGEMCIVGINATIIDNVKICDKVQFGGGTVVIKSIEKEGLYVGNPHRFVRKFS